MRTPAARVARFGGDGKRFHMLAESAWFGLRYLL